MNNCVLYKSGNAIVDNGIECDFVVVSARQVSEYLDQGYFKTPEEVYADTNNSGKLSNEEIRKAAKAAGLENWETGRIKGLKEALGYDA